MDVGSRARKLSSNGRRPSGPELQRQSLSVTTIARQFNVDRKTARKDIAHGLKPPTYKPRQPREHHPDPFKA